MKAKIILALVWTSFGVCENYKRSTVLTDESKRILEHFDFSNFDKQEALNYLDRQRYENQIRGKRCHCKLKRNHNGRNEHVSVDRRINSRDITKPYENVKGSNSSLKAFNFEENDGEQVRHKFPFLEPTSYDVSYGHLLKTNVAGIRTKRGHPSKKKHRRKSYANEYGKEGKRRRKKKKKKRKKRRYWGVWSEWTPCSVTCGRGRKIRWRKCIAKNCINGELEMGEKACQLPACNLLTKLLGL